MELTHNGLWDGAEKTLPASLSSRPCFGRRDPHRRRFFTQFLDHQAYVVFLYLPLCSTCKLIARCWVLLNNLNSLPSSPDALWNQGASGFSQPCQGPPAGLALLFLEDSSISDVSGLPQTGGQKPGCGSDLVVLAPKHPGHQFCLGADCSPDSPRSWALLESVWSSTAGREGGRRGGREGRRARKRKRELSFSLYLF